MLASVFGEPALPALPYKPEARARGIRVVLAVVCVKRYSRMAARIFHLPFPPSAHAI